MITFAKHIEVLKRYDKLKSFLHVALLGVHALVPVVLCHLQGDDGAAMIFFLHVPRHVVRRGNPAPVFCRRIRRHHCRCTPCLEI